MKRWAVIGLGMALVLFGLPRLSAQLTSVCGLFTQPCWTTAGRPATPGIGTQGFNLTLLEPEWWTGSAWAQGGGGGGGSVIILPTPVGQSQVILPASSVLEVSHQLCGVPCNLASVSITVTGNTTGWLLLFDATVCPSAGTVTPWDYQRILSDGMAGQARFEYSPGHEKPTTTGLMACYSTAGTPFTYTPGGSVAAFMAEVIH